MSAWTLGFVAANQVALIVVRNLADPGSGRCRFYTCDLTTEYVNLNADYTT